MQWSYRVLMVQANQIETLEAQLLALGSLEWEVCGVAASDPTLGLNSIVVTLKRPAPSYQPHTGPAGWETDPSGRFAKRYWDGVRWTEHVTDSAGAQTSDYPNVR